MECSGPPATTEQRAYLHRLRGHRSDRSTCCTAHAARTIAVLGGDGEGSAPMRRDMEALTALLEAGEVTATWRDDGNDEAMKSPDATLATLAFEGDEVADLLDLFGLDNQDLGIEF